MKSLQSFNVNGCLLIILLCGLMTIRCLVATRMLDYIVEGWCNWWGAKQCNYPLPQVPSLSRLQSGLHCKLLKDVHMCLPREEVVCLFHWLFCSCMLFCISIPILSTDVVPADAS